MKIDIINKLPDKAQRVIGDIALKTAQNAPDIAKYVGVGAGIAAFATVIYVSVSKTPDILKEHKSEIDTIHYLEENAEEGAYPEKDRKRDKAHVYSRTGLRLVKVYSVPFLLETLSITSFLYSNGILESRNATLASAFASVTTSFKDYRGRVIDRYGEKVDEELRYSTIEREKEIVVKDKKGNEKTKTVTESVPDLKPTDIYTRIYDENCVGWTKDVDLAHLFLMNQQSRLNDIFHSRGHMFLNEVLDTLGFQRTRLGQEVGWIYDPDDPTRDNYIDFGLNDLKNTFNRGFINKEEPYCVLNFNCDGFIKDVLDEK